MKQVLLVILIIVAALAAVYWFTAEEAGYPMASPTPDPSTLPTAKPAENMTVSSPKVGEHVGDPFTVTGTARTFEQNVVWALKTPTGTELAKGYTTAHAPDIGIFGPYEFTVDVPDSFSGPARLEVYESSAKDGSVINLVTVPIVVER